MSHAPGTKLRFSHAKRGEPTDAEILLLWRRGKDTLDIANQLWVPEHHVCSRLPAILQAQSTNVLQIRSAASRKSWRVRKRMEAARNSREAFSRAAPSSEPVRATDTPRTGSPSHTTGGAVA